VLAEALVALAVTWLSLVGAARKNMVKRQIPDTEVLRDTSYPYHYHYLRGYRRGYLRGLPGYLRGLPPGLPPPVLPDTIIVSGDIRIPNCELCGETAPYHIHIPKCAGYTFMAWVKQSLNFSLGMSEHCVVGLQHLAGSDSRKRPFFSILFRNPATQIVSQFMECRYDTWGINRTRGTEFPRGGEDVEDFATWLHHFASMPNGRGEKRSYEEAYNAAYGCYDPRNMQRRYLTCVRSVGQSSPFPHFDMGDFLPLDTAVMLVEQLDFVGVKEMLREGLCVYAALLGRKLPLYCDCDDHVHPVPAVSHLHHIPRYEWGLGNLTCTARTTAAAFIGEDAVLYNKALDRFLNDLRRIEKERGMRIYCGELSYPQLFEALQARLPTGCPSS